MQFVNKVELQGVIGAVKQFPVGDSKVVRFSLCTEYAYKDKDGGLAIDCTWHYVTAYPPAGESWDWLMKSAEVRVEGRLRANDIAASLVKPIKE